MAYTITTGLAAQMEAAVNKGVKEVNNTKDRAAITDAFDNLLAVLFVEFTAIDTGA